MRPHPKAKLGTRRPGPTLPRLTILLHHHRNEMSRTSQHPGRFQRSGVVPSELSLWLISPSASIISEGSMRDVM